MESTAAMVASETSSVGQVIDANQIVNMPLKGRMFFELALLAPGTTPRMPGSFRRGTAAHAGRVECPGVQRGRRAGRGQRISHRRHRRAGPALPDALDFPVGGRDPGVQAAKQRLLGGIRAVRRADQRHHSLGDQCAARLGLRIHAERRAGRRLFLRQLHGGGKGAAAV